MSGEPFYFLHFCQPHVLCNPMLLNQRLQAITHFHTIGIWDIHRLLLFYHRVAIVLPPSGNPVNKHNSSWNYAHIEGETWANRTWITHKTD